MLAVSFVYIDRYRDVIRVYEERIKRLCYTGPHTEQNAIYLSF